MKRFFSVLFGFCLILVLLVTSIQTGALKKEWYEGFYQRTNLAATLDVSSELLDEGIGMLVDYVQGETDTIQQKVKVDGKEVVLFNDKEAAHMVDVRALWQFAQNIRLFSLLLGVVLMAWFFVQHRGDLLFTGYLVAYGVFAGILVVLGLWFLTDFNSLWNSFHYLFFTNSLWMLDPATDFMIQICPESMFSSLILHIAFIFILLSLFAAALLFLVRRYVQYQNFRRSHS